MTQKILERLEAIEKNPKSFSFSMRIGDQYYPPPPAITAVSVQNLTNLVESLRLATEALEGYRKTENAAERALASIAKKLGVI